MTAHAAGFDPGDLATWAGVGVSLALGVAAFVRAGRANRTAAEANRLSEEANNIARQANEISARSPERSQEDHHVRWEDDFPDHGLYRITNKGRDVAKAAEFAVTLGERELQHGPVDVEPGGHIDFDATPEADEMCAERLEAMSRPYGSAHFPSGWAAAHVTWLTALGTRYSCDLKSGFTDYGA